MKAVLGKSGLHSFTRLTFYGVVAGFVNGLLGAGGGILIIFGLSPLLGNDKNVARDVFANALAVMMPVSVVSVISYLLSGRINANGFGVFALPAAAGGLLGAFLLDKLNVTFLKKLFAIIVIWSGIYMILRK